MPVPPTPSGIAKTTTPAWALQIGGGFDFGGHRSPCVCMDKRSRTLASSAVLRSVHDSSMPSTVNPMYATDALTISTPH